MQIRFEMEWIPPASLCTNGRSRKATSGERSRDNGFVRSQGVYFGNLALKEGPAFTPPYELRLTVRNQRKVDLDNLLIGYKSFVDGLVESGLIPSDAPDQLSVISIAWDGVDSPWTAVEIEEI